MDEPDKAGWTYLRDDRPYGGAGPPIVVYRFEDSRAARLPQRHLAGWRGILNATAMPLRKLAKLIGPGGPATLACCWTHLRREFYKLHVRACPQTATWTVERVADLWAVEARSKVSIRKPASTPATVHYQRRLSTSSSPGGRMS